MQAIRDPPHYFLKVAEAPRLAKCSRKKRRARKERAPTLVLSGGFRPRTLHPAGCGGKLKMSSASGSRRVPCFGGYFSLDDILTTNERVPCKVEILIPKLVPLTSLFVQVERRAYLQADGSLNTSSKEEDLKLGTKLDLPYWLAAPLLSRRIVSAEVPKVYRETYREILSADAVAVDLSRLQPQYYGFGLLIQKLPLSDVEYVNNSLIKWCTCCANCAKLRQMENWATRAATKCSLSHFLFTFTPHLRQKVIEKLNLAGTKPTLMPELPNVGSKQGYGNFRSLV
ncbi:hypothetical protein V5799_010336 [Amblyomma americanum]|uniref:DNA replication complex GINS protein PSF3 n=1 Tax=Amblyomma americanum TaxID=6943 RepID=A0AAQ4F8B4_AMBAM